MIRSNKEVSLRNSVDHKPIPDRVFAIRDEGFIRNDANADIEHD
jgi:hypothetical protein